MTLPPRFVTRGCFSKVPVGRAPPLRREMVRPRPWQLNPGEGWEGADQHARNRQRNRDGAVELHAHAAFTTASLRPPHTPRGPPRTVDGQCRGPLGRPPIPAVVALLLRLQPLPLDGADHHQLDRLAANRLTLARRPRRRLPRRRLTAGRAVQRHARRPVQPRLNGPPRPVGSADPCGAADGRVSDRPRRVLANLGRVGVLRRELVAGVALAPLAARRSRQPGASTPRRRPRQRLDVRDARARSAARRTNAGGVGGVARMGR